MKVFHIFLILSDHGQQEADPGPLVVPGELPGLADVVSVVLLLGLRQEGLIL